ncbi:MAG: hypothetical protein ABIK67_08250, partial [candidate division WOR-3 bacterium]
SAMSLSGPNWNRRDFYIAANVGRQWTHQLAKVYDEMAYKGHCHKQTVCAVEGNDKPSATYLKI